MNADLSVAHGACIQAAVLTQKADAPPIYVRNVTPLTIGILSSKSTGLTCRPVVNRNSSYPIVKTLYGTTKRDNQRNAKIIIFEGEQTKIDGNQILGSFTLSGLTESPKGREIVQILLQIDEEGAISTTATDKRTKKQVQLNIVRPEGFTENEITEMASKLAQLKEIEIEDREKTVVKMSLPSKNKRMKIQEEDQDDEEDICQIYGHARIDDISSEITEEIPLDE